jgi:geranylgeranyl reductase-like protein
VLLLDKARFHAISRAGAVYPAERCGSCPWIHSRSWSASDGWRSTVVIELGTIPGGYCWIFPKGDHLNIGVGGWESTGPTLRKHLKELRGEIREPRAVAGIAVRSLEVLARQAGWPGTAYRLEAGAGNG